MSEDQISEIMGRFDIADETWDKLPLSITRMIVRLYTDRTQLLEFTESLAALGGPSEYIEGWELRAGGTLLHDAILEAHVVLKMVKEGT